MKALVAIALLVVLGAAFVWERNGLTTLRAQNESLRAEKEEADRLAAENQELPNLRAAAGTPVSRDGNAELLRLRNEVRQLRAQRPDLEKLRAENQRLADELKSGKFAPRKLSDMEGFVAREKWVFAGFATPEAAVQSFFRAVATTNVEEFLQCATPEAAREVQRQMQQDPERFRKEFMEGMNPFTKISGFRIVERTNVTDDEMLLGIQFVADGAVMPLPLSRVGNEWKVGEPDKPPRKP